MARTAEEIIRDVLELPEEDRGRVMSALVDSFELGADVHEGSPADAKAYMAEVSGRIDDVVAGRAKGRPWREALADARARLETERAAKRKSA